MKKLSFFSVLSLVVCLSLLLSIPITSAQPISSEQKIKLKFTYVTIPNNSETYTVRSEDALSAKVKVYDKNTNDLITTHGEIIEKDTRFSAPFLFSGFSSQGDYYIVTRYEEREDGPAVTRLTVKMNVYSSGSFRQIDKIESATMAVISSGGFTLEDIDVVAISSTGDFPTTSIRAHGTGTITYQKTYNEQGSGGFSASALKFAGFQITYSQGNSKDFYARKPIDIRLNYSLY